MTRREQQQCTELIRQLNDDTLQLLEFFKKLRLAFEGGL